MVVVLSHNGILIKNNALVGFFDDVSFYTFIYFYYYIFIKINQIDFRIDQASSVWCALFQLRN